MLSCIFRLKILGAYNKNEELKVRGGKNMCKIERWRISVLCLCFIFSSILSGCASQTSPFAPASDDFAANSNLPLYHGQAPYSSSYNEAKYVSRLPQSINLGREKVILVDPRAFAWGAYDENGELVRGGIATAGADFCQDEGRPCRTSVGTFRIYSLGGEGCISKSYPIGKGGSLMPYCMFFHGGQSLHGSPDQMFVEANISHGCVHMRIPDVEWLRYNFARVGTKVVVLPYD